MRRTILIATLALAGCEKPETSSSTGGTPAVEPVPNKLAGVYPERFDCASVTTPDALTGLLGAPARAIDSPSSVPRGLPRPCTYEVAATPPQYWTYDIDCRDGHKQRADDLFAQYRKYNADRITQYNAMSDAGVAKVTSDAGTIEFRAPSEPAEVAVGAKGLDHNDQGLIFIDDDAPCYVRVIGPDGPRRLTLATLVAKNLTFANAPMTPRRFP